MIRAVLAILACLTALQARAENCPRSAHAYETMRAVPHLEVRPKKQAWVRQQLQAHSFRVIALGDSIMEGWPPALLDQPFGSPALNAGFGQDGTEQVLWRLRSIDWGAQSPSTVLLLVGTNDLRYPACAVYWGLRTVVSAARATFPAARIVVTDILPRGDALRFKEQEIATINGALRQSASVGRYVFLGVHDAFLCGHATPCKLFLPGNLHLTRDGYQLLTRLAAKAGAGANAPLR